MPITLPNVGLDVGSVSFFADVRGGEYEISDEDSLLLLLVEHINCQFLFLVLRESKVEITAYERVGFGIGWLFEPSESLWSKIAMKQRIVIV
jgi:hypothetical protein